MANVAKWLTLRIVAPAFEGSIPFIRLYFNDENEREDGEHLLFFIIHKVTFL